MLFREKAFCLFILLFSYSPIMNLPFVFYANTGAAGNKSAATHEFAKREMERKKSRDDGMNRS